MSIAASKGGVRAEEVADRGAWGKSNGMCFGCGEQRFETRNDSVSGAYCIVVGCKEGTGWKLMADAGS
jgi:hypothetical protein